MNIGEKIKRLRGFRGLTCEGLSELIDRTRPYLSSVENGHNPPTKKLLRVIADALDVDVDYFEHEPGSPAIPHIKDDLDLLYYFSNRRRGLDGIERIELTRLPLLTSRDIAAYAISARMLEQIMRHDTTIVAPSHVHTHDAFAFVMPDESMEPKINQGETVIVSTKLEPKDEGVVLALTNEGDVMIRVLARRGRQHQFTPANRAFPTITKAKTEIRALFSVVLVVGEGFGEA
ncbi:MAG: helix-turn-helix domain-containing protein [Planctomycetes bacterium]|nr:helix-turn-helix domain-containing protein [Planctomycetota bacterium]